MLLHFGLAAANGGRDSMNPKDGRAIFQKLIQSNEKQAIQSYRESLDKKKKKKSGRNNIQNGLSTNIINSMKMVARMLVLMGDAPKIDCLLIQ